MENIRYAYLFADMVLLFPVWLFLFIKRKDLRKEILFLGVVVGLFAYLFQYFYFSRDYWRPMYLVGEYAGIEDFLFGFFSAGIAGSVFEWAYGKRFSKRKNRKQVWAGVSVAMVLVGLVIFHLMTKSLKINSIYTFSFVSYLFGIVIVLFRNDLLMDVLMSGIFFGVYYSLVFLVFNSLFPNFVPEFYFLKNISGIYLAGFPVEETIWGASMGFAVGPLYEFYMGLKFKK